MSLDADAIRDGLASKGVAAIGARLVTLDETHSTNDDARTLAESWDDPAPHGTIVFAESQTGGRGRRGRRWISPGKGTNLLFSIVLRPELPPGKWTRFTHIAGLAVALGIEETVRMEPRVKWPNDIFVDNRKIAGILVESDANAGSAIVGIGLNVNGVRADWPEELRDEITSLREAAGATISRENLAVAVLTNFETQNRRPFSEVLSSIEQRSQLTGSRVEVIRSRGDSVIGLATGLGSDGELLVTDEKSGSTVAITSAESVRRL